MQTITANTSSLKSFAKSLEPKLIYRDQDGDYIYLDGEGKVRLAVTFAEKDPSFHSAKAIVKHTDSYDLVPVVLAQDPITDELIVNYSRLERTVEPDYPVVFEPEDREGD